METIHIYTVHIPREYGMAVVVAKNEKECFDLCDNNGMYQSLERRYGQAYQTIALEYILESENFPLYADKGKIGYIASSYFE